MDGLVVAVGIFIGWNFLFAGSGAISGSAPDFTLSDTEGQKHTLSEQQGKKVVLNFFNDFILSL